MNARLGRRWIVGALLVSLGSWFVVVAAGIFLPGTQPADGSGDPDFPAFRNGTKPGTFDTPGNCAGGGCHRNYRATGEPIYEPYDSWAGSMMANSTRDPLFWACLDIANQDDALLGNAGVGDFCIRCHSPKGWYEGRSDCVTDWGEEFDGSCLLGSLSQENNDFDGIQCHFCHRMYDASQAPTGQFADANAPYLENGEVYLSTEDRAMRGPYNDAQPPGRHDAAGSALHRGSKICGQCHNVTHPAKNRRDADTGADLGYRMPIERTYDEWLQSAFATVSDPKAATCQDCHMPPPDLDGDGTVDPAYACGNPPGLRGYDTALEGPVFTHFLRGGGTFMIDLLRGEYGATLGRLAEYQAAHDQSLLLLTRETATAAVSAPESVPAGGTLPATVRVTNLGGHKFPTGYPEGRRAWVALDAGEDLDQDGTLDAGEVSFSSGAYDPATGVLTHDPQEKIYEIQVGIFNRNGLNECDLYDASSGRKMFHFVLNDCVERDNRIPPEGFVPDDETAPVDYTYPPNPDRPGTLAHWDDTAYAVPVPPGATHPFLVRARVLYQTTSKEYVEFLRDESVSTCDPLDSGCNPTLPNPGPNRGEKLYQLWQTYGRSAPVVVAEAQRTVAVTAGAGAPGQASNPAHGEDQMRVASYDPLTGDITIGFSAACDASGHDVRWGPLSGVDSYQYTGAECGVGMTGSATFNPGAGAYFFLVVGNNGAVEGSYGLDAAGAERPEAAGPAECDYPQDLNASCE